jgi:hypothetical protein
MMNGTIQMGYGTKRGAGAEILSTFSDFFYYLKNLHMLDNTLITSGGSIIPPKKNKPYNVWDAVICILIVGILLLLIASC